MALSEQKALSEQQQSAIAVEQQEAQQPADELVVNNNSSVVDVGTVERPLEPQIVDEFIDNSGDNLGDSLVDDSNYQPITVTANPDAANSTNTAMMNNQQRRKRLQDLSHKMTMKSLGIEK